MDKSLDLGWCQGYMALQYHLEEAYAEANLKLPTNFELFRPPVAIFSNSYYQDICDLSHNKTIDYSFIGCLKHSSLIKKRQWVIDFALKHFTSNSIFISTDNKEKWQPIGIFDKTKEIGGFCPRYQEDNQSKKVQYRPVKENLFYFETMCQSKFVLCPEGDSSWTFRFYETLMCHTIPIVESYHHTYRTEEESKIPYKYILAESFNLEKANEDYDSMLQHNTNLFKQYHLIN